MFDLSVGLLQGYLTDSGVVALERVQLIMQGKGIITAAALENLSFWFPTKSDTNRAVESQKMARDLKFCI